MSLYSIRWDRGTKLLVGNIDDIISLINIFEKNEIKYKIVNCGGFPCKQEYFGCGGYIHWMQPDELWT